MTAQERPAVCVICGEEAQLAVISQRLDTLDNRLDGMESEIKSLAKAMNDERVDVRVNLAKLNMKAGAWGALAAVLTVAGAIALRFM